MMAEAAELVPSEESEICPEMSDLHVEEIMNDESVELGGPKCETIMEAESFQECSDFYNVSMMNQLRSGSLRRSRGVGIRAARDRLELYETRD